MKGMEERLSERMCGLEERLCERSDHTFTESETRMQLVIANAVASAISESASNMREEFANIREILASILATQAIHSKQLEHIFDPKWKRIAAIEGALTVAS